MFKFPFVQHVSQSYSFPVFENQSYNQPVLQLASVAKPVLQSQSYSYHVLPSQSYRDNHISSLSYRASLSASLSYRAIPTACLEMSPSIQFVCTGGTIDKHYPRTMSGYSFEFGPPAVESIMQRVRPAPAFSFRQGSVGEWIMQPYYQGCVCVQGGQPGYHKPAQVRHRIL